LIEAWIGLGANLGKRAAKLDAAVERIDQLPDTWLQAVSRYYRTPPWGQSDQPEFLNAVARVQTALGAGRLLRALLAIESQLGRTRTGRRWGPRAIDLDLLLYGEEHIEQPDLVVPHPRLHQRAFVLVPLAELAPDLVVPGQARVDALLAQLDDNERAGIRPGPDSGYQLPKNDREKR